MTKEEVFEQQQILTEKLQKLNSDYDRIWKQIKETQLRLSNLSKQRTYTNYHKSVISVLSEAEKNHYRKVLRLGAGRHSSQEQVLQALVYGGKRKKVRSEQVEDGVSIIHNDECISDDDRIDFIIVNDYVVLYPHLFGIPSIKPWSTEWDLCFDQKGTAHLPVINYTNKNRVAQLKGGGTVHLFDKPILLLKPWGSSIVKDKEFYIVGKVEGYDSAKYFDDIDNIMFDIL